MVYRGPLLNSPATTTALDDLLANPSPQTSAALAAVTRDRLISPTSSVAANGVGRVPRGPRPQHLGSLISPVGDLDGDGIGDLAATFEASDGYLLETRSGATGLLLWSRPATSSVFSAEVAGDAGFLLVSDRYEPGKPGLLGRDSRQVITVEALDGSGRPIWTTEVPGTFHQGPLRTTSTDIPRLQTVADVVGNGDDEVVLTLTAERRWRNGVLPSTRSSMVAVLDGTTGELQRGPAESESDYTDRWLSPLSDLDGDGHLELLERRWTPQAQTTHILSGVGAEWWSDSDADRDGYVFSAGGDLDGDGVDDLIWVSYVLTCTGADEAQECVIDVVLSARSGLDGSTLATWDDAFPAVVGDVDKDGRTDLQLGRPVRDDVAGTFGLELSVEDITGRVIRQTTPSHALPQAPWEPLTSWGQVGDVDADGAADTHWVLGQYEPPADPSQCPCAATSETLADGRLSTSTGAPLSPAPSGWPVQLSFDGSGDDYFEPTWGYADATASAFDGLTGGPLWSATVAVEFPYDWLSITWTDVNADGGTDTLFGVHEGWDSEATVQPRSALVLIDGVSGAVRWRLDTGGS